jgi:hypothetical protein
MGNKERRGIVSAIGTKAMRAGSGERARAGRGKLSGVGEKARATERALTQ